ncbi:uncharacterized protein Z520_00105 [Fonsecaea multimorphosa CBS 102226]|uniref:DUF7626 domain-containing protein n=1 Tax=Fonsecaea multimorphosa CBS 102226 TaxID=1442371 RepID=A0A0D2L320_9EURO|nr:uncharacterized protein Z520_00105 [Fonsecaea multimorphosa CBS 102226]KIY03414.1 hypothetical protein Z520_00105 [Fonsecaea multimorphosa CBS 102226]
MEKSAFEKTFPIHTKHPLRENLDETSDKIPKKPPPAVVFHQSTHHLPYFAHQQLDPEYFPLDIGVPVGSYPEENDDGDKTNNRGWDDDDSDAGADLESEADDDLNAEVGTVIFYLLLWRSVTEQTEQGLTPKPKRRHKFESSKVANAGDIKKMKIQGGRPAVAKKVTADLDSDDEMIVRMKEARFLEKDIAQALIDQGRTAYNPKTIGTRWRRIKAALQKRQDNLLDADLTDWHEGDDDVLLQAVIKAEKEVKRLKDDIESKKWRMPVVNFSQNACRDRYEALQQGCAKPTPESIENPTPEILERVKSRKDKERRIREGNQMAEREQKNVEANGWTSRMRTYF